MLLGHLLIHANPVVGTPANSGCIDLAKELQETSGIEPVKRIFRTDELRISLDGNPVPTRPHDERHPRSCTQVRQLLASTAHREAEYGFTGEWVREHAGVHD